MLLTCPVPPHSRTPLPLLATLDFGLLFLNTLHPLVAPPGWTTIPLSFTISGSPLMKIQSLGLLLFLVSSAFAAEKNNPARPNILWLIAEDFGQHLGSYGTKEVWTPNLDT